MRNHLSGLLSLLVAAACTSDSGIEYVPAEPTLSEGAVCINKPLGIDSGWSDEEGVELQTSGPMSRGTGPALHNVCGREEGDSRFVVEQALIFDKEYETQTGKTRYHVCTGTITRSGERFGPDARLTIALQGHKACEDMSRTYTRKKKAPVAAVAPTTPCERYSACVCALAAAKAGDTTLAGSLAKHCQETKGLLASTKQDDAACTTGLIMTRGSAQKAYGVPLPEICK